MRISFHNIAVLLIPFCLIALVPYVGAVYEIEHARAVSEGR